MSSVKLKREVSDEMNFECPDCSKSITQEQLAVLVEMESIKHRNSIFGTVAPSPETMRIRAQAEWMKRHKCEGPK
jgi:hypothetical protein